MFIDRVLERSHTNKNFDYSGLERLENKEFAEEWDALDFPRETDSEDDFEKSTGQIFRSNDALKEDDCYEICLSS